MIESQDALAFTVHDRAFKLLLIIGCLLLWLCVQTEIPFSGYMASQSGADYSNWIYLKSDNFVHMDIAPILHLIPGAIWLLLYQSVWIIPLVTIAYFLIWDYNPLFIVSLIYLILPSVLIAHSFAAFFPVSTLDLWHENGFSNYREVLTAFIPEPTNPIVSFIKGKTIQSFDSYRGFLAFPSVHFIPALATATAAALHNRRLLAPVCLSWTIAIILAMLALITHYLLDIIAGFFLFAANALCYKRYIWPTLNRWCQEYGVAVATYSFVVIMIVFALYTVLIAHTVWLNISLK